MCWLSHILKTYNEGVSVAGCLGYDVLGNRRLTLKLSRLVSVAGCLGYDVLASERKFT